MTIQEHIAHFIEQENRVMERHSNYLFALSLARSASMGSGKEIVLKSEDDPVWGEINVMVYGLTKHMVIDPSMVDVKPLSVRLH